MSKLKNVSNLPRHALDPEAVPAPSPDAATDADHDGPDADGGATVPPQPAAEPAGLMARDLRVATPLGTVFGGVDIDLPAGGVGAVVGASRTGKSTLLLALTGRMRHVSGTLDIDGHDGIRRPGQVRKLTSVARISDIIKPESQLTIEDCITERTLFDAASPRARLANYLHVARLLDLNVPRTELYGSLDPIDRTRVALALACIRPASLVVLDDLDLDVTLDEQVQLWDGIRRLATDGCSVIASTSERSAVPTDAVLIDLDSQE